MGAMNTKMPAEGETQPPQALRQNWFRRLLSDVFFVVRRENKWWLLPLIVILLLLAGILLLATLAGPLAPFIYPLL